METVIVIILLVGIYYYYKKKKSSDQTESVSELEAKRNALEEDIKQRMQELGINNEVEKVPMDDNLALFLLTCSIAYVDGEWSESEVKHALKFPVFREAFDAIDVEEFFDNLKSGKINVEDAISHFKTLSREEIIKRMIPVFETALVGLVETGDTTSDAFEKAKDILNRFDNISLEDIHLARLEQLKCTFDMNLDYAFFSLVFWVANSDKNLSSEKIKAALKIPRFVEVFDNIDIDLYIENDKNGTVDLKLAIDVLNSFDRNERMNCMVTCLATIWEDEEITEEERAKFLEILGYFEDLSWDEVLEEYQSL
jgi:hypothetical protein